MAAIGGICRSGRNVGTTRVLFDSAWLTFCHEFGHNIGGQHSFEDGAGVTGGVMDYGDGKVGGYYQFNTKYRKKKVCETLNAAVNKCNGKFQKDTSASDSDDTCPRGCKSCDSHRRCTKCIDGFDAVRRARGRARDEARDAARDAARDVARDAARDEALSSGKHSPLFGCRCFPSAEAR